MLVKTFQDQFYHKMAKCLRLPAARKNVKFKITMPAQQHDARPTAGRALIRSSA
jgi:hypothetical protein